jgi:hypothetical protein
MSQISKATQSSESDTDFIQDNTINIVYGDSLGSENGEVGKMSIDLFPHKMDAYILLATFSN